MPQFLISYLGGKPPTDTDIAKQQMANYQEWLATLGDAIVSPANPLKDTHTIKSDGTVERGSKSAMTGYTIIQVDNMEAAIEIAKGCPFLQIEGTLEVSELLQMSAA